LDDESLIKNAHIPIPAAQRAAAKRNPKRLA
jgi:hypothetical protein